MKITIEVPDDLFRRAEAQAAMQDIALHDLLLQSIQLASEQPPHQPALRRTSFPLIMGSPDAETITDEKVAQALEQMAEQ